MILPHDDFPATPAPEPVPTPAVPHHLPEGTMIRDVRVGRLLEFAQFSSLCYEGFDVTTEDYVEVQELYPWEVVKRSPELNVVPQEPGFLAVWTRIRDDFRQRGEALAKIYHRSLQEVSRVIEEHGTLYLIKVPMSGETLATVLLRERTLPEAALRAMLLPLLDGLSLAHEAGVIHHDVRPTWVHLDEDGGGRLAGFLTPDRSDPEDPRNNPDRTRVFSRFGDNTHYQGYEYSQEDLRKVSAKADLYALAAMTVEAMTGQKVMDAMTRLYHEFWLAKVPELCGDRYSRQFCEAVDKAFAVRADDRVGSAAEWRGMLGE